MIELRSQETNVSPPRLVVFDKATGRKSTLLDPNAWVLTRDLGVSERLRWKSRDGSIWHGVLYLPSRRTPGKRLPLVIQNHGFSSGFSLTGRARNFAGRALTALDIAVVQLLENEGDGNLAKENKRIEDGYEALFAILENRGLIDTSKIALQGWSRSGPQIQHLLTQTERPYAAAAFTDSGSFGWTMYTTRPNYSFASGFFGGNGFGPGLKGWLDNSPTFNLDRVRAPILMWEAHDVPESGALTVGQFDLKIGLDRLDLPNEHWLIPNGGHDLMPIKKRLFGVQLLTDWYRYWLKDEERKNTVWWNGETEATLRKQYERWRLLRAKRDVALKKPRRPLLDWTAAVRP